MMKRNKFRKAIAYVLLCVMSSNLFTESLLYAMGGPSSPEYSGFEPISASDMVDPQTGNFVYNLPILNVPGPNGGFSMSLSYHAGIEPKEEASWVGLGWSLNAGSINRTAHLFADDYDGITDLTHTYWAGGVSRETTRRSFWVLWGIIPYKNEFYDTYQGLGWNSPFHKWSKGQGSFFKNDQVTPPDANVTFEGGSKKSGSIFSFTLNRKKTKWTRYYIFNDQYASSFGSLYPKLESEAAGSGTEPDFDCYNIMDPDSLNSLNARLEPGGTLPAYDSYQVLANGVGGVIQPRYLQNTYLWRKDGSDLDYKNPEVASNMPKDVNFYYVGEYSNSFTHKDYTVEELANQDQVQDSAFRDQWASYEPSLYNEAENHLATNKHIEWFTNEQIADGVGSIAYQKGFMAYDIANPIERNSKFEYSVSKQIGGFMITNESGTTYHFSLPVYTYDEYSRNNRIDDSEGEFFKEYHKYAAYATNWLLTGITGPSYQDLGVPGISDEDMGYWVKLDYGLWSDIYKWRTPNTGMEQDIDRGYERLSRGKREVYYLDYIRTKSHTALFIKDMRHDAKGNAELFVNDLKFPRSGNTEAVDHEYTSDDLLTNSAKQLLVSSWENEDAAFQDKAYITVDHEGCEFTAQGVSKPVASLKLDEIILLRNNVLQEVLDRNGTSTIKTLKKRNNDLVWEANSRFVKWSEACDGATTPNIDDYVPFYRYHLGKNVLDVNDLSSSQIKDALTEASLQTIEFGTDYSLCKNTPNSYSNENLYRAYRPMPIGTDRDLDGKLTLNEITIKGKGGRQLIPSTQFKYGYNPGYAEDHEDHWGMYKLDYNEVLAETNEDLAMQVSDSSALYTHAWSLDTIITPSGARIEVAYEPKTYEEVVYPSTQYLQIADLEKVTSSYEVQQLSKGTNPNEVEISFASSISSLADELNGEEDMRITLDADFGQPTYMGGATAGNCFDLVTESYETAFDSYVEIISIDEAAQTITVSNEDLYGFLDPLGNVIYDCAIGEFTDEAICENTNCAICESDSLGICVDEQNFGTYNFATQPTISNVFVQGDPSQKEVRITFNEEIGADTLVELLEDKTLTFHGLFRFSGRLMELQKLINDVDINGEPYFYPVDYHNYIGIPRKLEESDRAYQWDLLDEDISIENAIVGDNEIVLQSAVIYDKLNETKGGVARVDNVDRLEYTYCSDLQNCNSADDLKQFEKPIVNFNRRPNFVMGNILFAKDSIKYGGFRVKDITLNEDERNTTTHYTYEGGYTTYEPDGVGYKFANELFQHPYTSNEQQYVELFKTALYGEKIDLLSLEKEIPSAGVVYTKVKRGTSVYDKKAEILTQHPSVRELEYQRFEKDFVQYHKEQTDEDGKRYTQISIENYGSRTGTVLADRNYGKDGKLLNESLSTYYHTGVPIADYRQLVADELGNVGRMDQVTLQRRDATIDGSEQKQVTVTRHEVFPTYNRKVVEKNYLLGSENETENFDYDLLTAAPLKSVTTDLYGNTVVSEQVLTHTQAEYASMGPKALDITNENMIGMSIANYSYTVNPSNYEEKYALINASTSTYSNSIPSLVAEENTARLWLGESSHYWLGSPTSVDADGLFDMTTFENNSFTGWNYGQTGFTNPLWKKSSQATRVNAESKIVEAMDEDSIYSSTKLAPNNEFVLVAASDARYHEIASSGAEFYNGTIDEEGGVSLGSALSSSFFSHTGKKSAALYPGGETMIYELATDLLDTTGRSYLAYLWAYLPNQVADDLTNVEMYYELDGSEVASVHATASYKAGAWHLLKLEIPNIVAGQTLKIATRNNHPDDVLYVDDFRFQPIDASVTSYVYDLSTGEMTHMLDGDNLYSRYDYDTHGKLRGQYQEIFRAAEKRVSVQSYNYKRRNQGN